MIEITRGDDVVRDVTVTSGGEAVALTGALAITFTAKSRVSDPDADAILRKTLEDGIEVDAEATNVAHITFAAADTDDLEVVPRILVWDVEIIDAEGLTKTVAVGYLRINPDVTRDAVAES